MALAVVHHASVKGSGVTIITTPAISTTAGNLAVVDVSYYQPTNGFVSITDSVGLSWSESIAEIVNADATNLARQRYAQITTGNASHTFSYNASAGDFCSMAVKEISGAATSSVLAETTTGQDSGFPTTHSLALTTSIQADCILCAFAGFDMGGSNLGSQTGSFLNDEATGLQSSSEAIFSSHLITVVTGNYTFSFSTSPDGDNPSMGIAAFKGPPFSATTIVGPMAQMAAGGMVGRINV